MTIPTHARRLVNEILSDGAIDLRIVEEPLPELTPGQLLVRVEAAPLHPSDMGMMMMAGDPTQAIPGENSLRLPVPEVARAMMAARAGASMPLGNEGAGTVIAAGDAEGEALIGRRVACFAGGMYADNRVLARAAVMPLPDGASARDGAAISVNPLTALAMVEVMRRDGASALVHTAAASSLGQILQRICTQDGIPLVNIVRRPEQAAVLRALGATHVLDSQDAGFMAAMTDAFAEVCATIAFDAVGGGPLAGMILTAMEAAQNRAASGASVYGSAIPKRIYVYGRLDVSPSLVPPTVGMAWGLSGFLLPHFVASVGPEVVQRMLDRVMRELTTTFAIAYTREIDLAALLDPEVLTRAAAKATNEKFLIRPNG